MKFLKVSVLLIIILFLGLYFSYSNGYYELKQSNKVSLTNEKIEQFELDILNGVDVSLEDYINEKEDYSSKVSDVALNITSKATNIIDSGIKYIFRKIGSIVE